MKEIKTTEVARSFSFKLNLGNFQMADFFCSQKAEAPEGKEEEVSEALYKFCKQEVAKSVREYKKALQDQEPKKEKWVDKKWHSDVAEEGIGTDYKNEQENNK